uniref:IS1634 family transposase n=1 Tax=Saccharopolyspora pogona TaxID=333966 RepID=UPI001CC252DF|nr:hypothetical protein [Saccharopolyspora pogona]
MDLERLTDGLSPTWTGYLRDWEAEIAAICRPRWVGEVLTITLTGHTPAEFRLAWRTDQKARKRLENRFFGKRILFTNRTEWTVAEVVAAYRSQSEVESGFRQMKDPHVVSFSPMRHWTDSKIRVYVFYCVLALAVAHLMRRQAEHAGLHLSVRELLDELGGIQETVLLYHDGGKGRPRAQRMLYPETTRRTVRHPPLRAHPLTRPPAALGNTSTSPGNPSWPAQTPLKHGLAGKLRLASWGDR